MFKRALAHGVLASETSNEIYFEEVESGADVLVGLRQVLKIGGAEVRVGNFTAQGDVVVPNKFQTTAGRPPRQHLTL